MAPSIIKQLCSIRDALDEKDEAICAAHLQLVIDTLSTRDAITQQEHGIGQKVPLKGAPPEPSES